MQNRYIRKPYGSEVPKNFCLKALKYGKTMGIYEDNIKTDLKQMGRKGAA
jgi:hypothetical protein